VKKYQNKQDNLYAKLFSFEVSLDGYRAIVINKGMASSFLFDSVYDPSLHDLMIAFCRTENGWKLTFFSTKNDIDCSEIAKKYGGGGHKGSAGATLKELPF
jgi:nanoRNase/pAp phosphatase (c-di-AMP/oligoRNAs hydrolase)